MINKKWLIRFLATAFCLTLFGVSDLSKPSSVNERIELPSTYDGREKGRVPAIKNQGTNGNCWAFASLQALEASLLPEEKWDFSEDHMTRNNGFSLPNQQGGSYPMSMAYLLSWTGPVCENENPYGDENLGNGLLAAKHVQEIVMIPGKDYEKIKRAVIQYGGVQSSLYTVINEEVSQSKYYNEKESAYCYLGSNRANHDAVIIGWDDKYPKENFPVAVNGDGAFICMNSWGDSFGDQGYFYVSYYDSNIGLDNIVYTRTEDASSSDHIYQSDLRGWVGQLGYGKDTIWISNVYESKGKERIKGAGFYATGRHTSYEIYGLSMVGSEEEILQKSEFEKKILLAKGTLDYSGYYTVSFDGIQKKGRNLIKGQRFAIIAKITTPDASQPAAIEFDADDGLTYVNLADGEGYISSDGIAWERVEKKQNCNLCLKAYTTDR